MLLDRAKETLGHRRLQILLGSLMGDGNLHIPSTCVNARFGESHREEDSEYLFWKYGELEPIGLFRKPYPVKWRKGQGKRFSSKCHVAFTDLYRLFYPSGFKIVNWLILQSLEPLALSVWYQDDGHLGFQSRSRRPYVRLSTCNFGEVGNENIRNWLKYKFDFDFRVIHVRGYPELSLTRYKQVLSFLNMVKPFIVPCMERKVVVLEKL